MRRSPPDDARIRALLEQAIQASGRGPGILIHELGIRKGERRIDVLVVTDEIHGYEIKSDRDGGQRLDGQVRLYSDRVDRATLVAGERGSRTYPERVPDWWGITTATDDGRLVTVRDARPNPSPDPRAVAEFLWRGEALALAAELGADRGVRTKSRERIWSRLAERVDPERIRAAAIRSLRARSYRNNWGGDRSRRLGSAETARSRSDQCTTSSQSG